MQACARGSWDSSGACVCVRGWSGRQCDIAYMPANAPVCAHGSLLPDGSCACGAGYTGSACEVPPPPTAVSYATCYHGSYAAGVCTCDVGWSGAHCELRACKMGLPVASAGGRPGFTCACLDGWVGQVCLACALRDAVLDGRVCRACVLRSSVSRVAARYARTVVLPVAARMLRSCLSHRLALVTPGEGCACVLLRARSSCVRVNKLCAHPDTLVPLARCSKLCQTV